MNGADLDSSTEVSGSDTLKFAATLDFTAVPNGTSFGPFTLDKTNLAGAFTFSNATYGSFGPTSGLIVTETADLLIVTLLGLFTPGAGLPGFDPTSARIDVTISRLGGEGDALDATLRLTALGPAVPEPAVWTMLAIGGLAPRSTPAPERLDGASPSINGSSARPTSVGFDRNTKAFAPESSTICVRAWAERTSFLLSSSRFDVQSNSSRHAWRTAGSPAERQPGNESGDAGVA